MSGSPGRKRRTGGQKWHEGLIPGRDDEEVIYEEFYGRNDADGAKFNGWTNNIMVAAVSKKQNRQMVKSYPLKELVGVFEFFKWSSQHRRFVRKANDEPVSTLADLQLRAQRGTFTISEPIVVQVVEKKSYFTMLKEGRAFVIGKLLVGDSSGIASLTVMNDGIAAVYEKVRIADHLVIAGGNVQQIKRNNYPETISLDLSKLLAVEIKLRMYDVRHLYLADGPGRPLMDPIFVPAKGSYTPSDLWDSTAETYCFPKDVNNVNLCGIVSYVGCMCRVETGRAPSASLQGAERAHYYCYRWIQLVDWNVKKPISLKLYVNSLNWEKQGDIVPGVSVVITNVEPHKHSFVSFFVDSTPYSQVYVNNEIAGGYLAPLPKSNREIIRKVVAPQYCVGALTRTDITWSAGGQLFLPVADPVKLWSIYKEEVAKEHSHFVSVPKATLARREEQTVMVGGYVYRIEKVTRNPDENFIVKLIWASKRPPETEFYSTDDGESNCRQTLVPDFKKHWYPFRRILPHPCADKPTEIFSTLEINRKRFASTCGPLLMPASYSDDALHLNELPIVGGETCYVFWIADPSHKHVYSAVWRGNSPEMMDSRVKEIIDEESTLPPENRASQRNKKRGKRHARRSRRAFDPTTAAAVEQEEKSKANLVFILSSYNIESDSQNPDENIIITLIDFAKEPL